ncbi:hypothetical protein HYV49_01050 [Candidatus Pacearchaeota archaeon]|nr:hypothetical protein [Candidatus Pacearchaeota archaeon]
MSKIYKKFNQIKLEKEWKLILKELKNNQDCIDNTYTEQSCIKKKADNVLRKLLKENGFLSEIKWSLQYEDQTKQTLSADAYDDPAVKKLREMIKGEDNTYYHFNFELSKKDGALSFNDSELTVEFSSTNELIKFLKDYKIKLDLTSFEEERKKTIDRLSELNNTINRYTREVEDHLNERKAN